MDELVEPCAAAEEGAVADVDVAGHEQVAGADAGGAAGLGAAVDGDVVADRVVGAEGDGGVGGGVEREVLGVAADDCAPADGGAGADGEAAVEPGVAGDADAGGELGRAVDHGERADVDVRGEACGRGDEGGGVDGHGGGQRSPASRNENHGGRPGAGLPMIRWSMKRTCIRAAASRTRRVSSRSAWLGEGSPDGWLWTSTKP